MSSTSSSFQLHASRHGSCLPTFHFSFSSCPAFAFLVFFILSLQLQFCWHTWLSSTRKYLLKHAYVAAGYFLLRPGGEIKWFSSVTFLPNPLLWTFEPCWLCPVRWQIPQGWFESAFPTPLFTWASALCRAGGIGCWMPTCLYICQKDFLCPQRLHHQSLFLILCQWAA